MSSNESQQQMAVAETTETAATAATTVGKITCGDLVIHPSKPWPWIGTVQPKVGDFARLCTSCGGLRVPPSVSKDANTQYKIRIESEEGPVPLCESEHEDSPSINVQEAAVGGTNGPRCLGDCHEDYFDDEQMCCEEVFDCCPPPIPKMAAPVIGTPIELIPHGHVLIPPHLHQDIIPPPFVALSVEGALPGRHFQVNWFPTSDLTDMDGNEKVIVAFKQRSMFQEGSPVAREGALSDQGLVKQVHRTVDAFVLPNYGWVIHDLPATKLKPLMDIEQCPGCFVIYKGWVGTVYNVWYRITFRMDDGTEFVLTDDQGESSVHMREENRKTPCADINQMYPGLRMKLRWMLLDNANWSSGYECPEEIKAKITKSRDLWNSSEPIDTTPSAAYSNRNAASSDQSAVIDQASGQQMDGAKRSKSVDALENAKADLEEIMENVMEEKLDIHIPPLIKREISALGEWSAHMRLARCDSVTAEDMATVTVVKMEPMKLDVEWLSQVVSDVPAGPKGNVIEGEELQNIYIFRSSRFFEPFDLGVRYRYVIEPDDKLMPLESYRRHLVGGTENIPGESMDDSTSTTPRPQPGDTVYIAVAKSSSKIDILWEDGHFETGVDPEVLVAQYSNQTERDYFPAMYVTFQSDSTSGKHGHGHGKHYHRGKSDSGMDDSSQTTRTSVDIGLESSAHNSLPNKFGVVKKAKNSEKYATVAWYEMKRRHGQQQDGQDEPVFVKEEDVSFYDLKFYYEFNYVGGTLVSWMDGSKLPPGIPNVGYVLRKNPDATVHVVWYDGKEETTRPWKLRQLTTRYDSEYTASDVDEEQHYYSPTEHEYEDLEDFRYYDYTTLSQEARLKRIGLIVAVMREVILRLCKMTLALDNYFPYADRKKVVKLTLSCNDVCNGFANLVDFRDTVKEMFENEQQQMNAAVANGQTSQGEASGKSQTIKLLKGRFVREERLVWQCANWLYDWTEAMSTLQDDMRKYRNKTLRKEQQCPMDEATPAVTVGGQQMDSASGLNSAVQSGNWKEARHWALCAFVADLQNSVEAGLSTVTGILSVPANSDVSSGIVVDFLNGLTPFFHMPESEEAGESGKWLEEMKEMEKKETQESKSSIGELATFGSSHKFLRTLVENPSKVGRLPCFSYTHHSELELSALYKQWPLSQFNPVQQENINLLGEDGISEDCGGSAAKSCQQVVDSVGKMMEDVLHGRRDISYTDDNVLKICNETADALCLSVLSIMLRIIESIYKKLKPQIDEALNEKTTEKMDGLDETQSMEDLDETQSMENVQKEIDSNESKETCKGANHQSGTTDIDPLTNGQAKEGELNGFIASESTVFELLPTAPSSHRFLSKQFDPAIMPKSFLSAVRREVKLLHSSLPPGIFVKTYEDRMDLFSCMIIGPQGTPYADGVFFFDVRLKDDYPTRPPHIFYKSMSKLLNPNLYEDGMVCLSLLGTWDGKETELWTSNSTLLQVFVSIQSLILVSEPYFNEPGFEKEKGSQSGATKSRDYNEAAVLRTLESLQRALNDPPEPFRNEIRQHIVENSGRLFRLLEKYQDPQGDNSDLAFPLFPVTQGFCLCIKRHAENLRRLTERWMSIV